MPDLSLIELWKSKLVRQASRMVVIDSPKLNGITSWFGRVTHGNPGEAWPTWENTLLWPLLQINLSELPFRPTELQDIELIRVFIHPEFYEFDCEKGEGWEVRVSKSLSGLVLIDADHKSDVLPKPISWELIKEDYADFEDLPSDFPEELQEIMPHHDVDSPFVNSDGTKVGGWPSLIQSEICWAPWNIHDTSFKSIRFTMRIGNWVIAERPISGEAKAVSKTNELWNGNVAKHAERGTCSTKFAFLKSYQASSIIGPRISLAKSTTFTSSSRSSKGSSSGIITRTRMNCFSW